MRKQGVIILIIIIFLLGLVGLGIKVLLDKNQTQEMPKKMMEQVKLFTLDEVARHNSINDCWTVISNDVYDLTQYINRHPGGDEILRACGQDATTLFTKRQMKDGQSVGSGGPHSQSANEQLAKLKIGVLTTR